MGKKEALQLLETQLDERITDTAKKRKRDKAKATYLKMFSIMLAGIVTVLIGLQGENFNQLVLRNIALTLGASITVVNAFDAFFDHKALWVRNTVTLVRLYALRRDLRFDVAQSKPNDLTIEALSDFQQRLDKILQDDLKEWLKLRTETVTIGGSSGEQIFDAEEEKASQQQNDV
jgi:hypothetical protein